MNTTAEKAMRCMCLLLALCLCLALVGCGNKQTPATDNGQDTADGNDTDASRTVMLSSEHYQITVADMSCFVRMQYEYFVNTYQNSGYMSYIRGTGGTGLSTSTPLRQQNYSVTTDEITGETVTVTWFDYFAQSALAAVKELLPLCENAYRENLTLSDGDRAIIEQSLETLQNRGEKTGYGTDGYLSNLYGKGVRLSDVRHVSELTTLAFKYLTIGQQQARDGVDDSDVEAYYQNNRSRYDDRIDYISVSFQPFLDAADQSAYLAEQQKYLDRISALAACTDEETFKTLLKSYFKEDVLFENNGISDEEADAEAEVEVTECVHKNVALNSSIYGTKESAWLFGATARRLNDTTAFTDDDKTIYTAMIVTAPLHADTAVVRSVGHILFKADSYLNFTSPDRLTGKRKELAQRVADKGLAISAETMSHELLAELFEEGKITEEGGRYFIDEAVFEEYGKIFNEDSNIFYNDVSEGDMVQTFNDWMFDVGRVEGEISYPDAVSTTYGYHIMYYRGNEQSVWRAEVRDVLVNEAYNAWREAAKTGYEVVVADGIDQLWANVGV